MCILTSICTVAPKGRMHLPHVLIHMPFSMGQGGGWIKADSCHVPRVPPTQAALASAVENGAPSAHLSSFTFPVFWDTLHKGPVQHPAFKCKGPSTEKHSQQSFGRQMPQRCAREIRDILCTSPRSTLASAVDHASSLGPLQPILSGPSTQPVHLGPQVLAPARSSLGGPLECGPPVQVPWMHLNSSRAGHPSCAAAHLPAQCCTPSRCSTLRDVQ